MHGKMRKLTDFFRMRFFRMRKLTEFLTRNDACREVLNRLAAMGANPPEDAWDRAAARDLVWAVTRPGVMSDEQLRRFLAEAVLAPIEHLLTDARSINILHKLRASEPITDADKSEAYAAYADVAYAASVYASEAALWAAADVATEAAEAARSAQAKWIRDNFALTDLDLSQSSATRAK